MLSRTHTARRLVAWLAAAFVAAAGISFVASAPAGATLPTDHPLTLPGTVICDEDHGPFFWQPKIYVNNSDRPAQEVTFWFGGVKFGPVEVRADDPSFGVDMDSGDFPTLDGMAEWYEVKASLGSEEEAFFVDPKIAGCGRSNWNNTGTAGINDKLVIPAGQNGGTVNVLKNDIFFNDKPMFLVECTTPAHGTLTVNDSAGTVGYEGDGSRQSDLVVCSVKDELGSYGSAELRIGYQTDTVEEVKPLTTPPTKKLGTRKFCNSNDFGAVVRMGNGDRFQAAGNKCAWYSTKLKSLGWKAWKRGNRDVSLGNGTVKFHQVRPKASIRLTEPWKCNHVHKMRKCRVIAALNNRASTRPVVFAVFWRNAGLQDAYERVPAGEVRKLRFRANHSTRVKVFHKATGDLLAMLRVPPRP